MLWQCSGWRDRSQRGIPGIRGGNWTTTCVNNNNYSVWHTFFVMSDDEGVIKGAYRVIRGNLSKLEVKSELHILILLGELRGLNYIYK